MPRHPLSDSHHSDVCVWPQEADGPLHGQWIRSYAADIPEVRFFVPVEKQHGFCILEVMQHAYHTHTHTHTHRLFSKDLGTKIRELQSGQSVSISSITASVSGPGGQGRERQLECDEVCAQEERNRKLALALEIENPVISPLDAEMKYSPFLLEQAR